MAYRRSTKRRATTRRRSTGRSTARRTYRSRASAPRSRGRARSGGGRAQTVRIVLETHSPSEVQRPSSAFQVAAAKVATRPKF